jgi:hypothetical protein
MCMKTKDRMTICPRKRWHFCIIARHFTQNYRFLAQIVSSFVAIRALENEPATPNRRNFRNNGHRPDATFFPTTGYNGDEGAR